MPPLRDQLVGAWELISYTAFTPDDKSNSIHPMGPQAQGIIMYTPDGYMSAQLQTPGLKQDASLADIGSHYIAYTGHFWLDESGDHHGPLLVHEMRNSNLPRIIGDRQRRLIQIKDEEGGRFLILSTADPIDMAGTMRIPLVRWRRLEENLATREPERGEAKLS
ncbi:hypothetical protein LTR09_006177 [Extremus antarcticus]|uniref:Lipocalin-like domain-containing protein n=1 Tax=Extremus antarcticus TaxID=702011 RepID=A0AAJ0DLK0_9PEZI|nr:hypothetical protein LTR09_006177 [Extremus antarcticus]